MPRALKVYGWTGNRRKGIVERFPNTPPHQRQTREFVAASSMAEVGRIVGDDPRSLQNLGTTGNAAEVEAAMARPRVVHWRPLDVRNAGWATDDEEGR